MPSLVMKRATTAEQFPVSAGTSCSFAAPVEVEFGNASVKSLSMNTVSLLLTRSVEPGAVLAIGLSNPAKSFARTVLVRVTQAVPAPGGCLVGGSFVTPLTYQELTALVM